MGVVEHFLRSYIKCVEIEVNSLENVRCAYFEYFFSLLLKRKIKLYIPAIQQNKSMRG